MDDTVDTKDREDVSRDMRENLRKRIEAHKALVHDSFPEQGTPRPACEGSQCQPPDKERQE